MYLLKTIDGSYFFSKTTGSDSSVSVVDEIEDTFYENMQNVQDSYFIENDKVIIKEGAAELLKSVLRKRREKECFPVINRGELWYAKLTEVQKVELSVWYEAWLNAPQTGTVPVKPEWVK